MSPFTAELIGTMVMILLGDGVVANVVLNKTKGFGAGWITITTAWALAVFAGVVIAGPYSGAHLNPAITIGFRHHGKISMERRTVLHHRPNDRSRPGSPACLDYLLRSL